MRVSSWWPFQMFFVQLHHMEESSMNIFKTSCVPPKEGRKACALTRCKVTFRWSKTLSHFLNCQTGRGLWFGGRFCKTPLVFSWPLEREGRRQLQMLLLTLWQPLALLEVRESEEREAFLSIEGELVQRWTFIMLNWPASSLWNTLQNNC